MKINLLVWSLSLFTFSAGCSSGCNEASRKATIETDRAANRDPPPRVDGCPPNAPRALDRVRFYPAPGKAARLVGGRFQGSNTSPTNDFVDLARIEAAPAEGGFSELRFQNDRLFRYIKYYAPAGSHGSVAELEFYGGDVKLDGEPFGTASPGGEGWYARALDGDPSTVFEASAADGNYVGIDIGQNAVTEAPTFAPAPGALAAPSPVSIQSPTLGAKINYTIDGSNPSRTHGEAYAEPIALPDGRTTIKAIAFSPCLFDSAVAEANYAVGTQAQAAAPTRGLKTYHVGNSLTDTINSWLEPIAESTGVDHSYARWTIPGTTVKYAWEHQGDGFGTPAGAERLPTFVRSFAPIDHMSVQPYADPSLDAEGKAAVEMFTHALRANPELQPWIYAQWAPRDGWQTDAFASGATWAKPPWSVPAAPKSWDDATRNHALYHEAFRQYVDERIDGKGVLIVPAGLALLELKRAIEAGKVPGSSDFFASAFADEVHLTARAQYLVGLVFYACFYRQSPEGRVTFAGSDLNAREARVYQRLAWDVVRGYRWSGVAP